MDINLKTIYTIGHSTRTLEEFVNILKAYKIGLLVDVRSIPRSLYTPQFNEDNLLKILPENGIQYLHLKKLGGLRSVKKDSTNGAWKNKSFRGFADYMQTKDFQDGLQELISLTKQQTVAIMCAEAVPWRCHRSMIGDALLVKHFKVIDIYNLNQNRPEKLTDFAKVTKNSLTYPIENLNI